MSPFGGELLYPQGQSGSEWKSEGESPYLAFKQNRKHSNHNYNKHLNSFAKSNKQEMTKSEACMWKFVLSRGQMMGYKFQRQRPIENYIVDFICLPLKLIIEVDGITHENEEKEILDNARDKELYDLGYTTLRFSSWEVLNKIIDVSILIGDWIRENGDCPPPTHAKDVARPLQRGTSTKTYFVIKTQTPTFQKL